MYQLLKLIKNCHLIQVFKTVDSALKIHVIRVVICFKCLELWTVHGKQNGVNSLELQSKAKKSNSLQLMMHRQILSNDLRVYVIMLQLQKLPSPF